jgi:hypothetical protein
MRVVVESSHELRTPQECVDLIRLVGMLGGFAVGFSEGPRAGFFVFGIAIVIAFVVGTFAEASARRRRQQASAPGLAMTKRARTMAGSAASSGDTRGVSA